MTRLRYAAVWIAISLVSGAVANAVFNIDFIAATLIAAAALTVNGIVAFREDRGKFDD